MSVFANSAGADRVAQVLEEAVRDQTGVSALRVTEARSGVLELEYSTIDLDWRVFRSLVENHQVTRKSGVDVDVSERDGVPGRPGGAYVIRVDVDEEAAAGEV